MDLKKENERNCDLKWEYDIPDPVPGLCYIEPKLKHDFKQHDGSLERIIPPPISTDPIELFEIDYMGIVMSMLENKDNLVFKSKSTTKDEEFDYQKYIEESFDDVNDIDHPHDKSIGIKEVYDVFPCPDNSNLQIIQTDGTISLEKDGFFTIEDCPNSNLYKMAVFGDKKFKCVKFKNSDHLLLEVEGDKIYFHDVDGIYRLTKE